MIANVVSTYAECGASYVSFANDNGQTHYVILSRSDEADAQDHALGLNGLYIEVNEQSNGSYDCLMSVSLDPKGATLAVANIAGTDEQNLLRIDIPPQVSGRAVALDGLRQICRAAGVPVRE
ncbi:immunity protein 10 of polymorphic toxin system [Yoonia maritima]|uniref:Immunity protein 10 of polymorphic toxin system n=1 Tax=Yoonia maritima TaxID=1435347 RepID=A0A2T0VZY8_9RHOB|nr:Imm10 family immunity protein [Yoonia maritima]PRY78145.1 immunity protein 10 of polymorphic toxin system [Yoonia maritima]